MMITRFAPSPTGPLHLGHARAAMFAHDVGRRVGGRFLLRSAHSAPTRWRPEWAAAIGADLDWLGLAIDDAPRIQSAHMDAYRSALEALRRRGLLYPCFCTRAAIAHEVAASAGAPHDPDGAPLYPGTCRALSTAERCDAIAAGRPHAWRLDMARALRVAGAGLVRHHIDGTVTRCCPERFGDVVLGRRDAPASYHLCATHDDAATGVTLVIRGVDLEAAADLHRLLQVLMRWPAPRYCFHPLVLGADGRRLSKRDGATSLRALRERGATPAVIQQLAGVNALLAGIGPPPCNDGPAAALSLDAPWRMGSDG